MAEDNQTISLPDGRQLGYLIVGKGAPVFYFHGTASSRLELACPLSLLKSASEISTRT
jgi:hypothetical protein